MTRLSGEEITSTNRRRKRLFACIFSFVWLVYVAVRFPPALHDTYFVRPWHDVACAESAAKHQQNSPNLVSVLVFLQYLILSTVTAPVAVTRYK